MNWRITGWLVLSAILLAIFIVVFERPARLARTHAAIEPPVVTAFDPEAVQSIQIRFPSNEVTVLRSNRIWYVAVPEWRVAQSNLVQALLQQIAHLRGRSVLSPSELRARPQAAADFGLNPPAATLTLGNPSGHLELFLGSHSVNGRQVFYQAAGVLGIFAADASLLDRLPQVPDGWRDRTLVPLDRLTFDRLRVVSGGAAFAVARNPSSNVWELTEPRAARADPERVGLLLRQLSFVPILGFLTTTSTVSPETFGLAPPRATLSLSRGSNDVYQLALGNPLTNAAAVFARRAGEPEFLAVPADALDLLRLSYKDLLDRRILRFDRAAVGEIRFQGSRAFQLERREASGWRIVPGNAPADPQAVERLLAQLATLEIVDIAKEVVTDLDLHTYGLAPPALRITLRQTPGDTNTALAILETGAFRDNRVFARVPGEQPVYALYPSDVEQLPTAAWELRDRQLWQFDSADIAALSVQHEGRQWALRRAGPNDWSAPAGATRPPNPFALDEALYRLGQARAQALVGPGDARGLGTTNGPQVTVQFRSPPTREPLTLSFGKASPAGNRYLAVTLPDHSRLTCEISGNLFDLLWQEIGLTESPDPGP